MNFEFYEDKPWSETDTELCNSHEKTVVIHLNDAECPLCLAGRQLKHAYETNLILTRQLHEQRELTMKAEAKARMK